MRKNKSTTVRLDSNRVSLRGLIASPFTFNHEIMGEGFYLVDVEIPRLSERVDIIPVMVSERLMDVESDMVGTEVNITGQFRSYNRHEKKSGNRLQLFVFAQEICLLEQGSEEVEPPDGSKSNQIELKGYICKKPVYRKTPLGREIADVLLAVNRSYGKSDYIPLILWGRNARYVASMEIGMHIRVKGRIQSREYTKKLSNDETEKRIAYEVSGSEIDVMN